MATTSQPIIVASKKNWVIENVNSPTANTEVELDLPSTARHFMVRSRRGRFIQVAAISGESGTTYVKRYGPYCQSNIQAGNVSKVYVQTPTDNDIIEFEYWD